MLCFAGALPRNHRHVIAPRAPLFISGSSFWRPRRQWQHPPRVILASHRSVSSSSNPVVDGGMEEGGGGRAKPEAAPAPPPAYKAQREAAAAGVSVHEWLQHVKASFLGLVRKVTARSEQEAAEADMRAAKEQVEATDEAEAKKKQLADR